MNISIKAAKLENAEFIASVVKKANINVANKFGFSKTNAAKHPSNCTKDWIELDIERGDKYFIAEKDNNIIGCVAYKNSEKGLAYLNRLAVLPEYQKNGVGKKLFEYHLDFSKKNNIKTVSIGIINEHTELKNWYIKLGFIETEIKHFEHLPFTVCLMNYTISNEEKND